MWGRGRQTRRGANAVEFALTAPVLVALLGGMLDFGIYLTHEHVVQAAVRDAARVGATTAVDDDPIAEARSRAVTVVEDAGLGLDGLVVTATLLTDGGERFIDVTLQMEYDPLFPFSPTPRKLGSHLSMRLEDQ